MPKEVLLMKRALSLLLTLILLLPMVALSEAADEDEIAYFTESDDDLLIEDIIIAKPVYPYEWKGNTVHRRYDSETLKYTVETCDIEGTACYLTKVWMQDPGRQIKKGMSEFHKHLATAQGMAKQIPDAALVINASGFVSPMYPEIPDNYPGLSEDYWYTALGSLTITNGEILRNLDGVPYYGLTLEDDGLHMYVGADNAEVLSHNPTQTWSFYVECPLIQDHVSILDREWDFANRKAVRTVIAKMDANNYIILTATSRHGLTLLEVTDFIQSVFDPVWCYDLDGGPSSALLCRNYGKKTLKTIYNSSDDKRIADIMGFVE